MFVGKINNMDTFTEKIIIDSIRESFRLYINKITVNLKWISINRYG